MRLFAMLGALTLGLALTGCGSQSYADKASHAVDTLRSATQSYNQNAGKSLSAQGASCHDAAGQLGTSTPPFLTGTVPRRYRPEARALNSAYIFTRRGLKDCARAAASIDYPLMIQASAEIAQADAFIRRARVLEH